MILVTGATGTVGRELVAELARRGAKVRALSRNPAASAFPAGVEIVAADLGDPVALGVALAGIERVFVLTTGPARLDHETRLLTAARRAGAARLVKLSALTVEGSTADDIITRWHRAAEEAVTGSDLSWTILRPGAFMSNTLSWAGMIRRQGQVFTPFVLGEALGREIGITEIPPEAARQRMIQAGTPTQIAEAVLATLSGAGTGPGALVQPTVWQLTGHPPHTFRDWVARHAAAFR